MKTPTLSLKSPRTTVALLALTLLGPAACTSAEEELERYQQAEAQVATHLSTFDTLDFDVFTHQKWDQLQHSHAQDIIVHWPDGHQTQGIDVHIADLQAMFVYAPDTRIQVHPIQLGSGEWTSVVGIMEGTFTQPMPQPDGTSIAPTGKSFKLVMNTVARWKDGVMAEEYLFWDNQSYLQQLGLAK
ncbi:ester cyclase [Corallococcus terminator]|uniref:Polyketide cyclase n=1 Tax=Corallococcus terminator TaxID=2316733 RepID=A0A3A8JN29_9BACT|nr:ester cyclase [Corallococcus terminator]RKG91931.1 polyketide cyclase [Corallococcus terminator]